MAMANRTANFPFLWLFFPCFFFWFVPFCRSRSHAPLLFCVCVCILSSSSPSPLSSSLASYSRFPFYASMFFDQTQFSVLIVGCHNILRPVPFVVQLKSSTRENVKQTQVKNSKHHVPYILRLMCSNSKILCAEGNENGITKSNCEKLLLCFRRHIFSA